MIESPGIYHDMPMSEYQIDPCPLPSLSRGIIKSLIYECPAKAFYEHPRLGAGKDKANGAMNLGSLVHSLLLEGVDIAVKINPVDYPGQKGEIPKGWTTKAIKDARDAALAAGKIPMLPDEYDNAVLITQKAAEQISESELGIQALRAEGFAESVCAWEEDGIWLRTRPDWLSSCHNIILDLKTTALVAEPGGYTRQIISSGTDIQAALYTRGINKLFGHEPKFIIWVQEVNPPYLGVPIALDPAFMALGAQKVEQGISLWRQCMKTGKWPGYPAKVCYVEPPPWALSQWSERVLQSEISSTEPDPTEKWGEYNGNF